MRTFKRVASSMLALVMVFTTFCFADLGLTANAWKDSAGIEMVGRPVINFSVPETIYLDTSGRFQYFVDTDAATGKLNTDPAKITGQITFSSSTPFENLVITRSDSAITYGVAARSTKFTDEMAAGTVGTGGTVITWEAKYTVDDVPYESHAYTYVYAPFTGMIGSGCKGQLSELWTTHISEHMEINVLTGFHSYNSAKGGYSWGGTNTGVKSPWELPIGSDKANDASVYGGFGPTKDESRYLTAASTNNYFAFNDYGKHSDIEETQDITTVSAGNLVIDCSRYTNTDQIPNLQAAAYTTYIVYNTPTDTNFETGVNESTTSYPSSFTRYYDTTDLKTSSGDSEQRYASTRVSSAVPPSGIAKPTAGNTKNYQLWVKQYVYHKYEGTLDNQYFQVNDMSRLNVTMVNKGALRDLYLECCGLAVEQTNNYGASYTTDFLTALQAAGRALGDPTATGVAAAYTALNTARDNLHLETIESGFTTPEFTFYVPEAIYLKASDRKTFEYYVDCTATGALNTAQNKTGGLVYFNCPEATSLNITCSGATVTAGGLTGKTTTVNTTVTGGSASSALTANSSSVITWTATFVADGRTYTATNYTVLYAPLTAPIAAAGRAKNKSGNDNWFQSVLYVYGIHSYASGFTYSTAGQLDDVFTAGRSYIYADGTTLFDDNAVEGALVNSGGTLLNANYINREDSDGNDEIASSTTGPTGTITVDTSRYTNLNQVPNLKAGWVCTDDEDDGGKNATMCSITANSTTLLDLPWTNNRHLDNGTDSNGKPWQLTPTQLSGAIANVAITAHAVGCDTNSSTGDRAGNYLYLNITVDGVSKADLRSVYRNAVNSGRFPDWYTTASWTTYQNALKAAAKALGDPTQNGTQVEAAKTALTQAAANLQFNHGTATETHISTATNAAVPDSLLETATTQSMTYNYGDTISAGHNDYAGYTYKGYSMTNSESSTPVTAMDGSDPASIDLFCGTSVSYTFYYEPKTYTITYDPDEGTFNGTTGLTTDTATFDASYKTGMNKAAPTRTGYQFVEWQVSGVSDAYVQAQTFTWRYAENKTFTAIWRENEYTLIYHVNSGTGSDYQYPQTVRYNQTIVTENNGGGGNITTSRTGFRFVGWNTKADGTGTSVNTGSPISVQTIVTEQEMQNSDAVAIYLYANWQANTYTLHYDPNETGLTVTGFPADVTMRSNENIVIDAATFTRPGYTFVEWNTQSDGNGTFYDRGQEYSVRTLTNNATLPNNSTVTLYAIWSINRYNIVFEENGGSTVEDLNRTPYNTIMTFPTSTKNGYTDLKWFANPNFSGTGYTPGTTKAVTENVTYYARWIIETYTITYDLDGGSVATANPDNYTVETPTIHLSSPTKTGYTFTGWTGSNGTVPQLSVSIAAGSTGNKNYTANWLIDTYQISYELGGGSLPNGVTNPQTYTYVTPTITLNNPSKTGYTFLGWTGSNGTTPLTTAIIAKGSLGNKSFTANWQAISYYVCYIATSDDVTNLPANSGPFTYDGAAAVISAIEPIRDGYAFTGWNTKRDGTGETYQPGDTIDHSRTPKPTTQGGTIELYTQWRPANFTVTWNLQGGTLNGSGTNPTTTVTFGGVYTVPKGTFFKSTYRFAGWYTAASGGTLVNDETVVTNTQKNQTIYARWENADYVIAFNGNGGTGSMTSVAAVCNVPSALPANTFSYPGHSFAGWATTAGGTMLYGDGATVSNLTDIDGATVTLYALWECRSFKIDYNFTTGAGKKLLTTSISQDEENPNAWKSVTLRQFQYVAGTTFVTIDGSEYYFYGWAYTSARAAAMQRDFEDKATFTLTDDVLANCTVTGWDEETPTITLYALWARKTRVTWVLEGGLWDYTDDNGEVQTSDESIVTDVIYGQNYVPPIGIYRDFYELRRWTSQRNGEGTVVANEITGDRGILLTNEDSTVYAFWVKDPNVVDDTSTYRIEYYKQNANDPDDYSNVETSEVVDTVGKEIDLTGHEKVIPGYTFNPNDSRNRPQGFVKNNNKLDDNGEPMILVLKLYYTVNQYTLSFDANGGEGTMNDMSVAYGARITLPANSFTKAGYKPDGWIEDLDAGTKAYSEKGVYVGANENVTLYTYWALETYTITYTDEQHGTVSPANPTSYTYLSDAIVLRNPVKTGWTFLGWTGSNGTTPQTSVTIAKNSTGNKSYTANWQINTYTISYTDPQNGTVSPANPTSYTVDTANITLRNPVKTGWTFLGWTGSNGDDPQTTVLIAKGSTGDKSYTANWQINTYTITYELDGGSVATANPKDYNVNTATITLNNPTKTGWTFLGWTGSNGETPQTSVTIAKGSTGNKTFTANWQINTYTISYTDPENVTITPANPTSYNVDTPDITLRNPVKAGYTFLGWTGSNGETPQTTVLIAKGSTGDKNYTANWKIDTYTINYTLAGGSVATANPTEYNVNTDSFTLNNPTREGWTFLGWTGSNGTTPQTEVTVAKGSTGNKTYTANWQINTYTISYTDPENGAVSPANPTSYTVDTPDITLRNPVKEGYTFLGWTGSNGENPQTTVLIAKGSTGNKTYTANWRVDGFTITYDLDGGSVATANPTGYTVNTESFVLNNPTRSGYTFVGWTGSNGETPQVVVTIAKGSTGNKTYTANWQIDTYTISYTDPENVTITPANPTEYNVNTPDITLNNPVKTGYIFKGWTGSNGNSPQTTVLIPKGSTGNKSYTANWQVESYTITYDPVGGIVETPNPTSYNVETATFTLNNPIKTGWKFLGWTGSNGETPQTTVTIEKGTTGNKNYTANWELEVYTLTFNGNGTTTPSAVPASMQVNYTQRVNLPTAEGMKLFSEDTQESRTFLGWKASDDTTYAPGGLFVCPAADEEFTAIWSANYYELDALCTQIANYRRMDMLPANDNDPLYAAGGDMAALLGSDGSYSWEFFNTTELEAALANATKDSNRGLPQSQQSKVDALQAALQAALDAVTLLDVDLDEYFACMHVGEGSDADVETGEVYPPCEEDEMHSYNSLLILIDRILSADDSVSIYTQDSVEELRMAIYGADGIDGIAVEVINAGLKAPAQELLEEFVNRIAEAYHTILRLKDADYTALDALITDYLPSLSGSAVDYNTLETYYTVDSVTNLKTYYQSIDREYKIVNQSMINAGGSVYSELKDYIDALDVRAADYTDVFYQILRIDTGTPGFSYPEDDVISSKYNTWITWAKANTGNISTQMDKTFLSVKYTDSSLANLYRALDGINWEQNIFAQSAVDGRDNATSYWNLLNNAIEALTLRTYNVTYLVNDGTDAVYTVDRGHEFGSQIGSFPPGTPSRDGFVFKGWSTDPETLTPASTEAYVYGEVTIYAFWGSVYDEVIELEAAEGSTTVIDTQRHYIYGLKTQLTETELVDEYLNVIGNGTLVVHAKDGTIGTGTVVELVSNYTGDVLETYQLVIFGDLNGDGIINSTDTTDVRMMRARLKDATFNNPYTFAADVVEDSNINSSDETSIRMLAARIATIDQVTREIHRLDA